MVDAGKWLLFGYELEADNPGDTVQDLQDQFINNPLNDLTLSIDSTPAFAVESS